MTRRIDAHHHVWDLAARDQPWMVGVEVDPLRRNFGIDEFAQLAEASGVAASVVVQTVADIAETEELLDLAAATPIVAGIVGWVDVAADDVEDQLDRLLARPSGGWLVGIRSLVQYESDPAWLARPAVRAGLREVARRDLCNELLVKPRELDAVLGAVGSLPEGRFIVDHLGKPPIASHMWDPWATSMAAVAEHQNVSVKFSGLVTEADWQTWTPDDLRPYLDHALAIFGPRRLLFGSDWPVCTLAAPYPRVVEVAEHFVGGLSGDERAACMGGNASAVYALDHRRLEAL